LAQKAKGNRLALNLLSFSAAFSEYFDSSWKAATPVTHFPLAWNEHTNPCGFVFTGDRFVAASSLVLNTISQP